MLAALLLNLTGGAPPPPPPAVVQRFGGGPFWTRYGYSKEYTKYSEEATSGALPFLEEPDVQVPIIAREAFSLPPRDYKAVESRVAEEVVSEMRKLRKKVPKPRDDDEDAAIYWFMTED